MMKLSSKNLFLFIFLCDLCVLCGKKYLLRDGERFTMLKSNHPILYTQALRFYL
jgi:hypothetical protein